jgi:broad specificity phosphatase PhoE
LALRLDVGRTDVIATSDETKALETARIVAEVNGGEVVVDARLREVSRPWVPNDYQELATTWLTGRRLEGWESQESVLQRMSEAIDDILAPVDSVALVVSHGLAMATFVASLIGVEPVTFWTDLRLPDAWWVDLETGRLDRLDEV